MNKLFLFLLSVFVSAFAFSQTTSDSIVLNQLGFYPHAPKIAVVKGNTTADHFLCNKYRQKGYGLQGHTKPANALL